MTPSRAGSQVDVLLTALADPTRRSLFEAVSEEPGVTTTAAVQADQVDVTLGSDQAPGRSARRGIDPDDGHRSPAAPLCRTDRPRLAARMARRDQPIEPGSDSSHASPRASAAMIAPSRRLASLTSAWPSRNLSSSARRLPPLRRAGARAAAEPVVSDNVVSAHLGKRREVLVEVRPIEHAKSRHVGRRAADEDRPAYRHARRARARSRRRRCRARPPSARSARPSSADHG